jgi:hypothetical protein
VRYSAPVQGTMGQDYEPRRGRQFRRGRALNSGTSFAPETRKNSVGGTDAGRPGPQILPSRWDAVNARYLFRISASAEAGGGDAKMFGVSAAANAVNGTWVIDTKRTHYYKYDGNTGKYLGPGWPN